MMQLFRLRLTKIKENYVTICRIVDERGEGRAAEKERACD